METIICDLDPAAQLTDEDRDALRESVLSTAEHFKIEMTEAAVDEFLAVVERISTGWHNFMVMVLAGLLTQSLAEMMTKQLAEVADGEYGLDDVLKNLRADAF